ncbi:hypothetical protein [Streptomyces sp. Tu 3180]|uniref:hypothetical protein n=1 Tax=Streptomyces sp. Tu 3180 TaxID=2682611 RepID=UPI00135AC850|nr:hypothetical protein [Streptomyces sp. Tu 3180]KAF3466063.1 hypothetical protein GL259_18115 [Streptomyces sp. Tu 3180]
MSDSENRQGTTPALVAALLAVCLGVATTVFDGGARTAAAVGLGIAVLVCAGYVGAAVRRQKSGG